MAPNREALPSDLHRDLHHAPPVEFLTPEPDLSYRSLQIGDFMSLRRRVVPNFGKGNSYWLGLIRHSSNDLYFVVTHGTGEDLPWLPVEGKITSRAGSASLPVDSRREVCHMRNSLFLNWMEWNAAVAKADGQDGRETMMKTRPKSASQRCACFRLTLADA